MWPSKWISDDAELQALLARWRGMSGIHTQIWEYSCSHRRLLIRMVRETKEAAFQPVASAYLFCHACESMRFDVSWNGMNIHIAKESNGSKPASVVTDGNRLHVVCGSVSAIETAVSPFIHLGDELRGLSLPAGLRVNTLRIEYVMVFVSGETPEEISQTVDRVTKISRSCEGMIYDILRAIVVVSFADIIRKASMRDKRVALVEHLSRELPGRLKIVHGVTEEQDGKFNAMLGKLSRLEFGQIEEFEK